MTRHHDLHLALPSLIVSSLLWTADASAAPTVQISTDPFTNSGSQHMTEVEPQIYAYGSTIVAVFQQGRVFGGGCSDIGFATSTDGGATWTQGSLPGLTIWAGGDRNPSVSDPSIAYNVAAGLWLAESLQVGFGNREIYVNRSGDGLNWDNPITVYSAVSDSLDKPWITCDNFPTSPFYGFCYIEWDDVSAGDRILMATSGDGGATWAVPLPTADNAHGLGGQPLVLPSGRVVVPYAGGAGVRSFFSDDGGNSWSASTPVSNVIEHNVAGGLRDADLPSATIDGDGTVYVAWADCRFRTSCRSNDIVITTSSDGVTWSALSRVPIDDTTSTVDHFLPGIGADRNSVAPNVGLAVVYYYYPQASCSSSTCQLTGGFISSTDGGGTWSDPTDVTAPMSLSWIASTSSGRMVGDYFSVSYTDDGVPHPVFGGATAPVDTLLESMFSTCTNCPAPLTEPAEVAGCEGANCPATPSVAEERLGAAESASGALRVSAQTYRVNIGAVLPLVASGPAVQNSPVLWSVEEGASGGSVSSSGDYTAPLTPGTYHVVANSGAEEARLTIEVFTVQ